MLKKIVILAVFISFITAISWATSLTKVLEYEKNRQYEEAVKECTDLINLGPRGYLYEKRAELYEKMGRTDLADADKQRAKTQREEERKRDKEKGWQDNDWWMGFFVLLIIGPVFIASIALIGRIVILIYKFIKNSNRINN